MPERGARMARREAREYREDLSAEQRSQPGCPAWELCREPRGQDTRPATDPLMYCGLVASSRDPLFVLTAIEAVVRAGDAMKARFGGDVGVGKKGIIDLVTEVDLSIEG